MKGPQIHGIPPSRVHKQNSKRWTKNSLNTINGGSSKLWKHNFSLHLTTTLVPFIVITPYCYIVQWVTPYKSNEISFAYGNRYNAFICAQQRRIQQSSLHKPNDDGNDIWIHKGAM
jgi:hypothetical protein